METLQNLLTFAIEFVAIAGFTGIIAHAFYAQHIRWLQTYCPPVAPYTPDTQVEVPQPIEEDVWEGEVEPTKVVSYSPVSRHFSPQLALPPSSEGAKPTAKKTRKTPANPKAPAKSRTRKRKAA